MRMISVALPLATAVLCAGAGASAAQPGPPGQGGPPPGAPFGAPPHGRPDMEGGGPGMIFISPCGEPFRGRPGDPYPVAAWFAQADQDHDGRLTRAEFVDDSMRFFAVLDRNQNGRVDPDELAFYEQVIVPEILARRMGAANSPLTKAAYAALDQMGGGMGGGMGGPGGGIGGGPGGGMGGPGGGGPPGGEPGRGGDRPPPGPIMDGAAPFGLLGEPEPVAASDLSFSGRISAADFKRRAGQRFDLLDTEHKGYLELASLPETMVQSLAGPRGRRRGF